MVGTLEQRQVLVHSSDQGGGRREQLEIVDLERRRLIGEGEGGVRVLPGSPRVGIAAALELSGDILHSLLL
jgi:hypothetical protein